MERFVKKGEEFSQCGEEGTECGVTGFSGRGGWAFVVVVVWSGGFRLFRVCPTVSVIVCFFVSASEGDSEGLCHRALLCLKHTQEL